jgi:signal transduction histidine kinase
MTGQGGRTSVAETGEDAARRAVREAARERQAHVRHELRAPLAVIYPLVSLLRDGEDKLSPEHREFLEVLERNVVRLEALITGVADSGWADCSPAEACPGEVVLGDVAEEVVALRALDDRGGSQVVVDAGPSPSPRAWADRDDVRQIIADLVRNAVAYATGGGRVNIRVAPGADPGTVTLEVMDTGPGMPPEELAQAFEFGFRGESARSRRVPGLGAGLWVGRELAARNGGTLSLAAEPGGGLRAALTLPAAAGRQP